MPDRVESFREVDTSKNRPRARLGFVKSIQNGLKKIKNLIKSRASRVETGLEERERMELDSRKKSRRNRMMRLFQNRFFQFSGPPGLRLAFLAAKKIKIWLHSAPEK